MSYARYLLRRGAIAVVSAYAVVTVMFFLTDLAARNELVKLLARARYGGATQDELDRLREQFLDTRGLDVPIHERYLDWLVDVATLDWGYSFAYNQPVIAVLDGRVQTTLAYVLPGVILALLLGILFGVFAALAKDSAFDVSTRVVAYALFGVPAFIVVTYYSYLSGTGVSVIGDFRIVAPQISSRTLGALTVATGLFAAQIRFSRTAALEQSGRAFVKMLRAKGASRIGLARHILRNAAIPIVSLSLSELLAVLVLEIYVIETAIPIDGLATASLRAVENGDIALVIWTTMVIVFVGIVGNFLQDALYGYLDPRISRTG